VEWLVVWVEPQSGVRCKRTSSSPFYEASGVVHGYGGNTCNACHVSAVDTHKGVKLFVGGVLSTPTLIGEGKVVDGDRLKGNELVLGNDSVLEDVLLDCALGC
jgi:hypothetical protein